jgi:hypothetical protein
LPDQSRSGAINQIGTAVLSYLDVSSVVDRVHTEQNGKGLVVAVRSNDGQEKRSILLNMDGRSNADPPELTNDVLRGLLSRGDLTPQQRDLIAAVLDGSDRGHNESPFRALGDVPFLADCNARDVSYLVDPILPKGSLIGMTGPAAGGKSTLITALCSQVSAAGTPALILDRDNPLSVVHDRVKRLGISDGPLFRVWGGWNSQEPGGLDSLELLSVVAACHPKPMLVIDSLGGFYSGDENDAAHMRAFLRPARTLAHQGCTVVILHNDGKSETSQDYRGSAAFKDCMDSCFHVMNSKKDGLLDTLTVRSYKSRFGFIGAVVYRYAGGKMVRDGSSVNTADPDSTPALTRLLAENPNVITRRFIELATAAGIPDHQARSFLADGIASGHIRREGKPSTGYRHVLVPPDRRSA